MIIFKNTTKKSGLIVPSRSFTTSNVLFVGPTTSAIRDLMEKKKEIFREHDVNQNNINAKLSDLNTSSDKIHSFAIEFGHKYRNLEERHEIVSLSKRVWRKRREIDSDIDKLELENYTGIRSRSSSQGSDAIIDISSEANILEKQMSSVDKLTNLGGLLGHYLETCRSYTLSLFDMQRFNLEKAKLDRIANETRSLIEKQVDTLTEYQSVALDIERKEKELFASDNENNRDTDAGIATNSGLITTLASTAQGTLETAAEVASNLSDTGLF